MLTDDDVAAIRRWADGSDPHVRAAVGLLAEHDHWFWDEGFAETCIRRASDGTVSLDFIAMARYWRDGTACSQGQAAILLAAADIGSGRWAIGTLDFRNRERVARAAAVAVGYEAATTAGQEH
jgi:hypothetical protein